ncbi:hypothetical protein KCV04_g5406, partial [Aureobasidium melanogenum]
NRWSNAYGSGKPRIRLLHRLIGLMPITNNQTPPIRHSLITTSEKALKDQEMQALFSLIQTAMFRSLPFMIQLTLLKTVILMRLPLQQSNPSLVLFI